MVGSMLGTQRRVPPTCDTFAAPLSVTLEELRAVLANLTPGRYSARMGEVFANASIGGHVRHCLDHARALVDGHRTGIIDYDQRARGTAIESDPAAAIAELGLIIDSTRRLAASLANEPVGVAMIPTRDGESTVLSSTLAREFAFVLSHTVHHNATIRSMAVAAGCFFPESFGYAPSTLAHKDRSACAQ